MLSLSSLFQYFFPDAIKKVYVINSPGAISALFSMAKRVLSKVCQNSSLLFYSLPGDCFTLNTNKLFFGSLF